MNEGWIIVNDLKVNMQHVVSYFEFPTCQGDPGVWIYVLGRPEPFRLTGQEAVEFLECARQFFKDLENKRVYPR